MSQRTQVKGMHDILKKLQGGDLRSIGRADEVAEDLTRHPELFPVVFEGMLHEEPLIRMRSADALEKVTAKQPDLLQPYKHRLIHEVARVEQQEVRWHAALMLSRLRLTPKEQDAVYAILLGYLEDESRIVKTNSMQALADLARHHDRLRPRVLPLLEELTRTGSPAMKSRGRKLLKALRAASE